MKAEVSGVDRLEYGILERAFQLLIHDVDMLSTDEDIFQKVFDEMCDTECKKSKNCKDCIREYYIEKAREDMSYEENKME